jgi:hypothetical protein
MCQLRVDVSPPIDRPRKGLPVRVSFNVHAITTLDVLELRSRGASSVGASEDTGAYMIATRCLADTEDVPPGFSPDPSRRSQAHLHLGTMRAVRDRHAAG